MRSFLLKSRKSFVSNVALWASFVNFLSPNFCYTQDLQDPILASLKEHSETTEEDEPKYTVNFNNVPIIEVIRFVSKITNTNFVFSEPDLQFNVTIVSEEPIAVKNIFSALIQVLRIHQLVLLEQENNLLITTSPDVNQIPTIVSSDLPGSINTNAPIVTRVFRIRNANVTSIASIIRPMTSKAALIETSTETRQLIVTDITTNVEKIASLLSSLDAPHTPLEVESYVVKNIAPAELISLTTQILSPFSEGNPLIFVPQNDTNTVFIVSTPYLIEKAMTVMEDVDMPPKPVVIGAKPEAQQNIYVYKILHRTPEALLDAIHGMVSELEGHGGSYQILQALKSAKFMPDTNSLLFVTDTATWTKLQEILGSLDSVSVSAAMEKATFYVYKIERSSEPQMRDSLMQMAATIRDKELTSAIESMKWIKESNSIVFSGTESAIKKLQQIVPPLDAAILSEEQSFYVYKIQYASEPEIISALHQMAETMQDPDLSDAINHARWIKASNSIIFTASTSTITKLKGILTSLDTEQPVSSKAHFLIYNPKYQKGEDLENNLKELTKNLKNSGLSNPNLITTLESMKWVPTTHSLVFTGDQASLDRVQAMIQTLDVASSKAPIQIFIYKPKYLSETQLQEGLDHFAQNLNSQDPTEKNLSDAIHSAEWVPESQSFVFKASTETLTRLKQVLASLDTTEGLTGGFTKGFYLYKLQYAPGNAIIQNLKTLSKSLSESDISNKAIIKSIDNLKWIKENNSLLITGSNVVVEHVKTLIAEFDVPSAAEKPVVAPKSEFYIYKPIHQTPQQIQTSLEDFAKDLQVSGLVDPDFLHTLSTVRYVPATQSLLFTGTADSLAKVKDMLATIDVAIPQVAPIQKVGSTTFLIYKIQHAAPAELINSLKSFAADLPQSNPEDAKLADTINSVKWIKETNSLLFTGNEEALSKIDPILQKFDLTSLHPTEREGPATYFVYTPVYQSGEELISILCDFMHNLVGSGVTDKGLFDAISHLKYIDKTNSLVISGDSESIQKVEQLLARFDVPNKGPTQPTISAIENTNFLIYKLQYHKGSEIQSALKKVALSLNKTEGAPNKNLVEAIDSLQWIEVTNSLLGTGEPSMLAKIKDLIQNLDVPLRQVFIEVLVVETTMFNAQNFGLQWGSQVQYLNKTIGAMGNFPTGQSGNTSGITSSLPNFAQPIANTTASTPPVQSATSSNAVPFTTSFDLGVIGDIIMHKGKSFISLGSLVTALQQDADSVIVMNPKIITQDGHTSSIFVGQNIPFIGSFVSNSTSTSSTLQTSNIEYRDVGVNLTITPTLGTNNVITLDLNQDISEQTTNTTTVQNSQVSGIQTTHTTMVTRVHVPDKHFIVLTGMLHDAKRHFRTGIPCLGGLPVVGAIFSEDDRDSHVSNVIIFLRPFIIDSFEDYDRLTSEEEDMFKENSVLQTMKEEIDDGTEMIKSIMND